MPTHCRPTWAIYWSAGAAAVLCALSTQAAVLGHSRVISLPHQPLRLSVLIKDVSPAEQASLTARIAPSAAWHEAGLSAPVDLSTFRVKTVTASQPNTVQLFLESSQSTTATVIDVLVDIQSDVSTQRHQVSVLQAPQPTPVALAQARAASVTPSPSTAVTTTASVSEASNTTASTESTYSVRSGQSLSRIARHYRSNAYSEQQFMVAVLEANPRAFIHGNLNLLRAGATLNIPDAQQIAAVSPQKANQLYQTHLQWFDDYRQRLAQGLPVEPMMTAGQSAPVVSEVSAPESQTDRLQLATDDAKTIQADQKAATAQELAYNAERLALLESATDSEPSVKKEPTPTTTATDTSQVASTEVDTSASTLPADTSAADPSAADTSAAQTGSAQASPVDGETTAAQAASGWLSSMWVAAIALLVLVALAIAWFLRRSNTSRLDVVDELSPSTVRMREKLDKNTESDVPHPDDVEFREIK
ncbi:FimV family protein [Paenalcaligenes hominis]|uniref:type IV pilus assembly protein FimV n=1 Tax=Paenalcaligenes hominis TaxID=643674 RepID=UPI00352431F5